MRKLLHWFVHRLHWQRGFVETWWEPCDGGKRFMVGYRCMTCGVVTSAQESFTQRRRPEDGRT